MIQCDKEMSIIDVCRKVARERNARTVLRFAPKTSHQSNGFVEAVHGHIQGLARCYQTQIETNTGIQLSAISPAIPFAIRYAGFVLSRFTMRTDCRTPFQYLLGTPHVSPLCLFGESVFALISDHEVRAAKLTNRWMSGCCWGRDASSDEHLVVTKHGLLKCRSVRRKPPGEQWSGRVTVAARGTKWNFDVEMDSGIPGPQVTSRPDEEIPTATARVEIPTVPPPAPPPEEHVPEMRGQGVHAKALRIRAFWSEIGRTPGCPACETPGPGKSHTRECKTHQDAWDESRRKASAEEAKRGNVGDPDTRPLDPSSSSTDPNPKRSKTTSVTENENLADQMDVVAKTKMVICDRSCADPAKTKMIGKVVRYTNILGAPISDLLNEDGMLIDTGQIIIAQKLQECKNDINVTTVSWEHCVTSKDKYITIVSTVAETTVAYLGFEYRSVHDGDRRGFTVKPTAKNVEECLDIVQLQNAKQ